MGSPVCSSNQHPLDSMAAQASNDELACTYAALILHDAGVSVTADNISKLTNAAGVSVTPFWSNFFEDVLKSQNLDDIILNAGAAAGPAGGAVAEADAAAAPEAEAEPEEEEEEESSEDMDGFSLFM